MKQLIIYDTTTGNIVAAPTKAGEPSPEVTGSGNISGTAFVSDDLAEYNAEDIVRLRATLSNGRQVIFTGTNGLLLTKEEDTPDNEFRMTFPRFRSEEEGDFTFTMQSHLLPAQAWTAEEKTAIISEFKASSPSYEAASLAGISIDVEEPIYPQDYYVDIADNNLLKTKASTGIIYE